MCVVEAFEGESVMSLIYIAIALLFILIIIWLALQPKQGTKASNAPEPIDDSTYQLPKPQDPSGNPATPLSRPSPATPQLRQISYEAPSELTSLDTQSVETKAADSSNVEDRIRTLMQQNRKLDAIKLIRSTTGWGLKQSKDYLDAFPYLAPLPITEGMGNGNPTPPIESFDIDHHDINDRVRLFMQRGRKIDAIKLVRTVTNWSLKEAKNYIDHYPDVAPLPITERGPVKQYLKQLLADRRHMDAIDLVQRRTGMVVTEAKDYLEQTFNCDLPF